MARSLRILTIIMAAGLALSAVEGAGLLSRSYASGYPMDWRQAMRTGFGLWMSMAAITPLPVWMAHRFPLGPGRWLSRLPLHLAAAVAFVTLHLMLDIFVQTHLGNMTPQPLGPHLADLLGNYLAIEMVVYAAVAGGIMYALAAEEARARELAAETLRARLSEARLEALQLQLAPHFLFNTLNAISTLALRGDAEATCSSLALLGTLLRRVLEESPRAEVTLESELAFIRAYLELQQLRFGDRLVIRWKVEADTREALVPHLLLQPVVENAIRHGLETSQGGVMTLGALRFHGRLVLEISDRAGDPPAGAAPPPQPERNGIGLSNTRERLATLYGEDQSLELNSGPRGTTVRIRIPFHLAPRETP